MMDATRTKENTMESTLPTWEQMSDRDKAAAILHAWKIDREGRSYAREHYPAKYVDHPALTALDPKAASTHAQSVTGRHDDIFDRLGPEEYQRLDRLNP